MIRYCFFLTAVVLSFFSGLYSEELSKKGSYEYSLKRFQGKKNLVLVFAPAPNDERFKKTQEGLLGRYQDFRKKSLGIFYVFEADIGRADDMKLRPEDSADLRKAFSIEPSEFRVIFVDKKGTKKRESKEALSREDLDRFLGF